MLCGARGACTRPVCSGIQTVLAQVLVPGQDRPTEQNVVIVIAEGLYVRTHTPHMRCYSFDDGVNCCASPYVDAQVMRTKSTVYAVAVGSNAYPDRLANITGECTDLTHL
jgi:hypothetical protein